MHLKAIDKSAEQTETYNDGGLTAKIPKAGRGRSHYVDGTTARRQWHGNTT